MKIQIIDFAQWYSGMERSKVEAAYQRYLKERRKAFSQARVSGTLLTCVDCGKSDDTVKNRGAFNGIQCYECKKNQDIEDGECR